MITLPIPEFSDFVAGFASCGASIALAVATKAVWPKIKALFVQGESIVYAEYKAGIDAAHAKIDQLSNAAASAVNAIRGDVAGIQKTLAAVDTRIMALEKAVGLVPPAPAAVDPALVTPAVHTHA
jgi:Ni,Fe-hydrogenase III large subunit